MEGETIMSIRECYYLNLWPAHWKLTEKGDFVYLWEGGFYARRNHCPGYDA